MELVVQRFIRERGERNLFDARDLSYSEAVTAQFLEK